MRRQVQQNEGENLFQRIGRIMAEERAKGRSVLNMAWGQPQGPAMLLARQTAAEAVMSEDEQKHGYQNNGSPGVPDFARKFVQAHFSHFLEEDGLAFLPIPGIKPMLGIVQLACRPSGGNIKVAYMSDPGFPTPKDWGRFLGVKSYDLPLNPNNQFVFEPGDIHPGTDLVMCNYPHNPSGQIVTAEQWTGIAAYCVEHDIRLFNDNPYHLFAYDKASSSLAEVAVHFPELSWAEALSASKEIGNGCGWRVGAIVGSSDFVADVAKIKGATDSGFSAPLATGVLNVLVNSKAEIEAYRDRYENRIKMLIQTLQPCGMSLAQYPKAGLFTLWHCPKFAFGRQFSNADEFNMAMVQVPKIGVAGVPFGNYIRYAVTSDIASMVEAIRKVFSDAEISY